jgi:hypothetical protein
VRMAPMPPSPPPLVVGAASAMAGWVLRSDSLETDGQAQEQRSVLHETGVWVGR